MDLKKLVFSLCTTILCLQQQLLLMIAALEISSVILSAFMAARQFGGRCSSILNQNHLIKNTQEEKEKTKTLIILTKVLDLPSVPKPWVQALNNLISSILKETLLIHCISLRGKVVPTKTLHCTMTKFLILYLEFVSKLLKTSSEIATAVMSNYRRKSNL